MRTLRDDVREVFSKEQMALGDVSEPKRRLIQNAMATRPKPDNRPSWVAGLAAFVLAAIVIGTFVFIRISNPARAIPAATPSPNLNVAPTPLAQHLNVPDSTPVILYHDPATFDQIDGITWDGKVSGRVGTGAGNGGVSNAQGSLYSTNSDIRNRSGQILATLDITPFWADDGVHVCDLAGTGPRSASSQGLLQIGLPGQTPTNVARVGTFYPAGLNAGVPYLVACSPGSDRAIVVQSGGQGLGTAAYWVVQLSTGRVLWSRSPTAPNGEDIQITASHDGKYVAENHSGQGASQATIYGPDGSPVGSLADSIALFSWDGSVAVTWGDHGAPVSIIKWRDDTVIWKGPAGVGNGFSQGIAEPAGSRLALGIHDPAFRQTTGFAPVDLYVVSADGKVILERKDVYLF